MARKPSKKQDIVDNSTTAVDSSFDELISQKQAAWDALRPVQADWADRERLLINRPADSYSQKSTRSHVTDGHLSTLAFERQARVAAQLPTGTIYSLSSDDDKAATLMNLILNKYILPGANSQLDALTKLRMSGVYSSLYGACPILYDYRVDDEYIGPDFWIINPRNFYPQPGKNSVRDCDWVMISTIVSVSYLENISKRGEKSSWNTSNVKQVVDQAKAGAVPSRDVDSSRKTSVENIRTVGRPYGDKGSSARIELVTKYEKGVTGKWITFAPDYKEAGILRSISNPHKNGRIPVVMRQCFPLIDSIWGLGDFERGITLQRAKDSLINLYLDGVKLSIFPPLKIDPDNVTMSSIKMEAGRRWFMKDPNAVTTHDSGGAQALNNFQGTFGFLSTSLASQFGSTDTSVPQRIAANPAFGKTPQAIEAQQDRESARDNWDRFQLEKTIEDLLEGMINLLAENQEKPINFHIFDSDVEQIQEQFSDDDSDDVSFMKVMGKSAKLTIPKSLIKGNYKFIVDASSTMRDDEEGQVEGLGQAISLYLQNPQGIDQLLQQDNYRFQFGNAFKSYIYNLKINDPDSIITKLGDNQGMQLQPPQIDPNQLNGLQDPDIRAMAQQMFGQGQQGQMQTAQAQQPPVQGPPMSPGGINGQ